MAKQKPKLARATSPIELETIGEVLPDGSLIEVIGDPVDRAKLSLVHRREGQTDKIGSELRVNGLIYRPASTIRRLSASTHFPSRLGKKIEPVELFAKVSTELRRAVPKDDADRLSFYSFSTWFPEFLSFLPALWITGLDPSYGLQVLSLLACFCFRPLRLGHISRNALNLVAAAHPTLLMLDSGVRSAVRPGLDALNHRDLLVLDRKGIQRQCFSKAILSIGVDSPADAGAIRVALGTQSTGPFDLKESELIRIADEYQPLLETNRVTTLAKVRESRFDVPEFTFPTRATAAALGACLGGDPDLTGRMIELLRWQDTEARAERSLDPSACLTEILLGEMHRAVDPAAPEQMICVKKIAMSLNTLVRERGGIREHSAEEVGHMLKKMGVLKIRRAGGVQVVLSDANFVRVHQLARGYSVAESVTRRLPCRLCDGMAPTTPSTSVGMQEM